jgi:dethiobiotin synthetase
MRPLFITGAGTEIGKTYVTAALTRGLSAQGLAVRALKPVASGVGEIDAPEFLTSDTAVLLAAQGLEVNAATVRACSPWRFKAPLAPDQAAALEGRSLNLADLAAWCSTQLTTGQPDQGVLIEGAGGVMSPATQDATVLDWIEALACPALLVTGTYLGAISHALTALAALKARGVEAAGLVVNETQASPVSLEATLDALARFAPQTPRFSLRWGGDAPADLVQAAAAALRG